MTGLLYDEIKSLYVERIPLLMNEHDIPFDVAVSMMNGAIKLIIKKACLENEVKTILEEQGLF